METRQQRLIRRALEGRVARDRGASVPDASLQDKAIQHTEDDYVPRTLTPHEWEEYYREHGVPKGHLRADDGDVQRPEGALRRTLRRFFARLRRG